MFDTTHVLSMLITGKYSDLTIICGGETFKLHRFILCPASSFFEVACNGKFLEAQTATITLEDDDVQAFKRMLLYLYVQDYNDSEEVVNFSNIKTSIGICGEPVAETSVVDRIGAREPTHRRMMNNIDVYAIADKYDLQRLKQHAQIKFGGYAITWPIKNLPAIIRKVDELTPSGDRGLRETVNQICRGHIKQILKDETLSQMVKDTPSLAFELLQCSINSVASRQGEVYKLRRKLSNDQTQIENLYEKAGRDDRVVGQLRGQLREMSDQLKVMSEKINDLLLQTDTGHDSW